jgi:hypothetical protein
VGIAAQDLPFLCALSERFPRFSLESQALLLTTHWIFKAWRVYPSDASFLPGEAVPTRPLVHRRDEPARLSLGMVASQQSLLPFHLASQF